MSEDQLCLNISVSSSPSLRRKPLTTQQRWARKKQNAGKRKMNSSSQPEERRPPPPAERADRRAPQKKKDGGGVMWQPPPPAERVDRRAPQKKKDGGGAKTSSLFKHNPDIPALLSVQKQTMPLLLSGRDAVVRSQTGSGKTLAYAVPVVQSLQALQQKVSRSDGPLAVIIVPTREVCGTHCDSEP
ncbi:putative ATP-dependent RNA helicase DDX31 [Dissostichus eleginoides]|uniref:ATP-dependent RNA helicase n=1 Tax=Dissostichus eleginoides TaxID=100907 RepID=A0AAD9F4R9_DISEL|nr:putative ATP-dependent RNA helicase DDX31 [Dissostichus eleginoides]